MKLLASTCLLLASCAQAQSSIGSVAAADADVVNGSQGALAVSAGRVLLIGSGTVTARDHTAEVDLARGGIVRVCRTSGLHITGDSAALLLGLDRGAMEIRMKAEASDVVMTPDLRFTSAGGPLDLRMRVTRNGDTCVENRGRNAPVLTLTDVFGAASYQLKPGQHVLFEHGSLREVVDRETTPCGCPPDDKPGIPIAEALLRSGGKPTHEQLEAAHPFPQAVSEGLAEPAPLPAQAPGVTHVQVATTLTYDPAAPPARPEPAETAAQPTPPPPRPAQSSGPLRSIGRFFKRLFVR